MAELSTKKRNKLPAESFADPKNRKYPLSDAAHVRNAAARFEQNKDEYSSAEAEKVKGRIAAAAKRHGIDSKLAKKGK